MRLLAKLISAAALAGTLAPAALFFVGTADLDEVKNWMLAATAAWFVATPLWMERKAAGQKEGDRRKTAVGTVWAAAMLAAMTATPLAAAAARDAPSSQPFEWLRHARVFILDAYTYPLYPKIEFDARKFAATMADMHVNTVRVATSGNYWLVPCMPFGVAPDLGKRDILAECIAECKPRGIRVVPYVRAGGEAAVEVVKPQWAYREDPQGNIRVWWDLGGRRSAFCWNTGYRQAFYALIEKLARDYEIDGMYFDAWLLFYRFTHPKICYCEGCRTGFRAAAGLELPFRANAQDYTAAERETIRRYHDWYRAQLLDIFRETKRLIRSHKNIPLIFNLNHARNIRNPAFTAPEIVDESDAFLYEMSKSMLERVEGTSLAISHGLAVWPYSDAYHGYPRIPVYQYGQQQHLLATMAFGGSPTIYHSYVYVDHPEARGPVREAFGTFERNRRFVEGFRPEPFCAIAWNENDPPGHAENSLWKTNAALCRTGALAACLDRHIQATSLLAEDFGRPEVLGRYQVLYLPDLCSLSDRQMAGIRRFVAEGGGLVMTYATSLYDENGKRRPDFALGDLARIQRVEPDAATRDKMQSTLAMGSAWDLYLKARPGQQALAPALAGDLLPMAVYEPVKVLPGGAVAADIVMGRGAEPLFPGLVLARHGKGKVAYVPAALDAMYRQTRFRQFAGFLRDVVAHVSPRGLPYEVDAPATLIANMMSRGDTRVLHLINWTGCNYETEQQEAYYVPPVKDVAVRYKVPHGKRVTGVKLFVPAHHAHRVDGGVLHVTLPTVDKYQGVVIEME
jgi:hypothetical protein